MSCPENFPRLKCSPGTPCFRRNGPTFCPSDLTAADLQCTRPRIRVSVPSVLPKNRPPEDDDLVKGLTKNIQACERLWELVLGIRMLQNPGRARLVSLGTFSRPSQTEIAS